MIATYHELQTELASHADNKYCEFTKKLSFSNHPFIGVRIPIIRKIVAQIPREKNVEFLKEKPETIEEVMARGMIICKLPYDEMLKYFDSQIKYIDNWSACDVFCSGLRKQIKNHLADFFETKIVSLLKSNQEFTTRVGLVILKSSYIRPEYLDLIFDWIEKIRNRNEYYVKMAIAWLLAECFIKFPSATTGYLVESKLPKWTYNKTISKICDSYRVDAKTKTMLKRMRK